MIGRLDTVMMDPLLENQAPLFIAFHNPAECNSIHFLNAFVNLNSMKWVIENEKNTSNFKCIHWLNDLLAAEEFKQQSQTCFMYVTLAQIYENDTQMFLVVTSDKSFLIIKSNSGNIYQNIKRKQFEMGMQINFVCESKKQSRWKIRMLKCFIPCWLSNSNRRISEEMRKQEWHRMIGINCYEISSISCPTRAKIKSISLALSMEENDRLHLGSSRCASSNTGKVRLVIFSFF